MCCRDGRITWAGSPCHGDLDIWDGFGEELACGGDFEYVEKTRAEFGIDGCAVNSADVIGGELFGVVCEVPDVCPEKVSVACGQEFEDVFISLRLGAGGFDGEGVFGGRAFVVDSPPEIECSFAAVHYHIVSEFDDEGVEVNNVAFDCVFDFEDFV